MLKSFLTLTVLIAGTVCFAASGVRIDLNASDNKILLTPGKTSEDIKISSAKDYCLSVRSPRNLTDEWTKFSFSFIPEKDGEINIHFMGSWHQPEGAEKNIAVWTAYDNITVSGTEAKNADFEFVNQKNLFDGWEGNPENMVTGAEDAQSGKNYVIVWHNSPVYQTLKVKKGQEVTITFFAKASEGPVQKKSDITNI